MRIGIRIAFLTGLGLITLTSSLRAADEKPAAFKDDKEKASYAIGMSIGKNLQRGGLDVDIDVLASALRDVQAGKEGKMTDKDAQDAIRTYQQESQKKVADKNKKAGEEFLAENKKKEGVKTHEVKLPDGSVAEMQYKVLTQGSGPIPKSNDVVSVNYRGTLVDGKEFDNSSKRGGPMKRQINGFVRGWTAALEMMPVGSKWELYLPASLAYGDAGNRMSNPPIEPGSALIFEMELVSTEAPAPPAAPQPLTSDIIKVPSADELKKGAKIEVIKPEEAARLAAQAQTNNPAPK